ncbi:MAG: RNA polymerase sigma factor [Candidatus Doudnabacteria bacterium]|nr:RNA polymerase sigma factor [Candidatus Doudnabacteria bacterium]
MEIAKVYKEFSKDVFRYCMFHLHNKESAEDCTSETFSRWIANKSAPSSFEELKPWLIGVARNVIREKYREISKAKLETSQVEIVDEASVENEALNVELVEIIKQELDKLDDTTREVIILKIWEDFTFKQIAEVIEESESNTKLIYYRGLEKIKIQLGERDKGKKLYAALPLPIIAGALKHLGSATEYSISTSFQAGLIQTTNLSTNLISVPQTMSILTKIKALTLPQWVGVALVTGTVVVAGAVGVIATRPQPVTTPPAIQPTSSTTSSTIVSTEPTRCSNDFILYTDERLGVSLCVPQTAVAEEQLLGETPSSIIRLDSDKLSNRKDIDVKPFIQICLRSSDSERSCNRTGTGAGDLSNTAVEKTIHNYRFTGNEMLITLGTNLVDRYTAVSRTSGSQTVEILWGYSSYAEGVFDELETYKQALEEIVESIEFTLDLQLSAGWKYVTEANCGVIVPVPPKKAPYIYETQSGNQIQTLYWRVHESISYSSPIGSGTGSWVSFTTDDFAGDNFYHIGMTCIKDGSYLTFESIKTKIQSDYDNSSVKEFNGFTINPPTFETIKLWGEDVLKVNSHSFQGYQTSYYVIKNGVTYYIAPINGTIDSSVRAQVEETQLEIFNNLKFN